MVKNNNSIGESFKKCMINIFYEWQNFGHEYGIDCIRALDNLKKSYKIDLDKILDSIRSEHGFNVIGLLFVYRNYSNCERKISLSNEQKKGLHEYFQKIDSVGDGNSKTPLLLECEKGEYETAMVLAFLGADVKNGSSKKETPLYHAKKNNFDEELSEVSTNLKEFMEQ